MATSQKVVKQVVLAARKYTLRDVVLAWRRKDWPVMADAARLYPSLVTALQVDPTLVMLSIWGHKKARMCDLKLRQIVFAARRDAIAQVPGGKQLVEQTHGDQVEVVGSGFEGDVDDEAAALLADIHLQEGVGEE